MLRASGAGFASLGEREIGAILATAQLGRDGHILEPAGVDLTNYRRNPVILWQHDPNFPIGIATSIGLRDGVLAATIQFAPAGVSTIADQCCALAKAGIVKGISIGFDPTESEPLDPKRPRAGLHITRSELLEASVVSIPADTGAGIVARSFAPAQRVALFSSLPSIAPHVIERTVATLPWRAGGALMSHAAHVWTLGQIARERDQRYSREIRRAELAELRGRERPPDDADRRAAARRARGWV